MTPYAKLIHNVSEMGRLPKKELINLKEIYSCYFFYKNINQTLKNKLIFVWSRISYLIIDLIYHRQKWFLQFRLRIMAYIKCILNLRKLKDGDLNFRRNPARAGDIVVVSKKKRMPFYRGFPILVEFEV